MSILQSRSGKTLLQIDDASSRLVYDGSWRSTTVNGTISVHASTSSGSTVKFAFNGTFVAVYGVIDGDAVTASFKLDDQDPVTQAVPQPSTAVLRPNWPFFWSPLPLDAGLHELTVTVNQGTFNFDYITYTTLDDSNDSTGNPKVPVTSESSDAAVSTSTSPPSHLDPGAIAGIVVGAVLFLVGVMGAVVFLRRRSARRVRHRKLDSEKPIDIIYENAPKSPPPVAVHRTPFRRFSRVYRPTPPRSVQSSKTATSSAPTSITQSSAMFTSVIMLSPALSMVSEEDYGHHASSFV
ncbi:hypothetical protein GSI_14485 [Ganoderma sinense ZZ0214-1]|uniref:Uncharacterized protein n=1 Tax=Ganoderma sinense ZZ0214-1 TaxID=1077348 RepID=A0A2G8RNU0_9APHY|nr:hypothetical protein GSI_14485 [Ganoderma sinense ZZ0214-1]